MRFRTALACPVNLYAKLKRFAAYRRVLELEPPNLKPSLTKPIIPIKLGFRLDPTRTEPKFRIRHQSLALKLKPIPGGTPEIRG